MIDTAMLGRLMSQLGYFKELSDPGSAALIPLARAIWGEASAAERARWDALRAWLEKSASEYKSGDAMSIAESVHGASAMREVLAAMDRLEGPNYRANAHLTAAQEVEDATE